MRGFSPSRWVMPLLLGLSPPLLAGQPEPRGQPGPAADLRLRSLNYDPGTVVSVPVKRGVVTLIQLGDDETITDIASGLGGDCSKPEMSWCVAAQPGGRALFIKPKSGANAANTLAVLTDKRAHSFRLVVLAESDPRPPIYRLQIRPPAATGLSRTAVAPGPLLPRPPGAVPARPHQASVDLPALPALPAPLDVVAERKKAKPQVRNTQYSLAEGPSSQDIVPTLIFDDGRFTYLRFPGNRDVPAVFHVQGDGSESLVNTRMEDELLIVDRVSRRLMLRAGSAVVGVWNEAFDLDGAPPEGGMTVPGVQRVLRTPRAPADPRVPQSAGETR